MHPYTTPRWFKIALVLLIGLPVSWGTFNYINLSQVKRNAQIGVQAHQNVEKILHSELNKISLAVSSLHILFEKADTIDRPTFYDFTLPFLRNLPGIKALEWTPKVSLAQRADHEQRIRAEGFPNYSIKSLDVENRVVVEASAKAFYYPIQYIVPQKWNDLALGVDLSSNPLRHAPIKRSEQIKACIVSKPLQLIQNKDKERSFLILQSVYQQDQLLGSIQGVYNMNAFIDTILTVPLQHLTIKIYDQTTDQALCLYESDAQDTLADFSAVTLGNWEPIAVEFGGRTWKVYTNFRPHLLAYPHRPIAYTALAMSLMMMLIVIAILLLNDRYARDLQKKVATSTLQLSEANNAQAILLKEIHHRVKNNLQVITGLLSLQGSTIEDEATKALFEVSQLRVQAMGMLHEQLYQSENLSRLSYGLYLRELVHQLLRSIKGPEHLITVDLQVPEDIYLNLDTAIPLGLLINELITNSLKYGFPQAEAGQLYLHLRQTAPKRYCLLIGDNGVGFSTPALPRKTSSLGLKLVRQLVRQLNGTLQHLEKRTGTHYRIEFVESD